MTLVLQWRRPVPPITLRWRGLDDVTVSALAQGAPPTAIAAIIGPPGASGGAADITREAGAAIGALKAVRVDAGDLAQLADKDGGAQVVGVTTIAAALGDDIIVRTGGMIEDDSWNWAEGPVWLGSAGALTQAVPTTGRLVRIGRSAGPTGLIVEIEQVAILN